jgi:hypothetical protein
MSSCFTHAELGTAILNPWLGRRLGSLKQRLWQTWLGKLKRCRRSTYLWFMRCFS